MWRSRRWLGVVTAAVALAFLGGCADTPTDVEFAKGGVPGAPDGKGKPNGEETAGNNLSYPVIWSEAVQKVLPGTPGMVPVVQGEWWYWWGTEGIDPDIVPLSCLPDPDDASLCDDGVAGTATGATPGVGYESDLVKAFVQKDQMNQWQAASGTPLEFGVAQAEGELFVDWIDWGDNLESVDWYTKSQVRTEVVLFQENPDPLVPWLEYGMRHVDGWGIDEAHGLAATVVGDVPEIGPGTMATVFSPCARLTIQKLTKDRDDPTLTTTWNPETHQWDGDVNAPIFNLPVWSAGDGPGYYNAEINVKGRIIFGYTWNVRRLNDDGAGDYRATFSFDQTCGTATLNTFFAEGVTEIMVPLEEEAALAADDDGSDTGGGTAMLDTGNNLTYIDIRILERGGGGGGGGGGKP